MREVYIRKIRFFWLVMHYMHDSQGFFIRDKPVKFWLARQRRGFTCVYRKHHVIEFKVLPLGLKIPLCIFGRHSMAYSHTTHDGTDHYKCSSCSKSTSRSFDGYSSHYRSLNQGSKAEYR